MPRFVRLDENLNVIFSYTRESIKLVGDIEIPQEYYLDAITFQRDENGQVIINRITEKEQELKIEELKKLRTKRNTLLEQTDRYATLDYPHSNLAVQQSWFDYRQALRDLPANTENPANPVWPVQPTA
jgi:adenylate kinase family enzyme